MSLKFFALEQEARAITNLPRPLTTLVPYHQLLHSFLKVFDDIGGRENRLHWVKDVVTQEDTSPQLQGKASTNISLIKSWVLNLLRIHGYDSMTEALSHLSHNLPLLLSFCH